MKKWYWLVIGTVGVFALLFLFWIGTLIGRWGDRGFGMAGGYIGHMGWGFSPFGWLEMGFGMLFLWLVPLGVIALIVFSVVTLVHGTGGHTLIHPARCANCGKGIQADWQACPHCGTKLK